MLLVEVRRDAEPMGELRLKARGAPSLIEHARALFAIWVSGRLCRDRPLATADTAQLKSEDAFEVDRIGGTGGQSDTVPLGSAAVPCRANVLIL